MPLLNIDGREVVESGAFVLRSGDRQAEMSVGKLKFRIRIDESMDDNAEGVVTAIPGGGELALPPVSITKVVFWSGSLEGGDEAFIIAAFIRGLDSDGVHAHSVEYSVTRPVR